MSVEGRLDDKAGSELELAALLCSRLCHDLVSPIGAISTGMEILVDEKDENMRQQVISMLTTSVSQASNRLQFARMAYGAGTGMGGTIDLNEAKRLALALVSGGKVDIDWQCELSEAPKTHVKLMMNLVLIGIESLPRGGTVRVMCTEDAGNWRIELDCAGTGAKIRSDCRSALDGSAILSEMEPKAAQAFYTKLLAKLSGMKLSFAEEQGNVQIRVH